jgi:hypothetical protein
MQTPATATAILCLLSATVLTAGDWPSFRGRANNGIADGRSAPVHWTANDNVAWKATLPRPANGSPIVSRRRVFVTSAEDEAGTRRSLYRPSAGPGTIQCIDPVTGEELWKERTGDAAYWASIVMIGHYLYDFI